jgi:hypothetical protein
MTFITKELLCRGYFPKELPHPFNSLKLANINNQLLYSQINAINISSIPLIISLPKIKYSRRDLIIPNPIAYIKLANEIDQSFSEIYRHIHKSKLSKSIPIYYRKGRAFGPRFWHGKLIDFRAEIYSKSRFILNTDIQKFYPTVYTHSIPWALHTKPVAKIQRNNSNLLGNRLDKLVRQGQDNQTLGIPIGPDTSLFLAEVLLSSVDQELISKFQNVIGYRFVDDYCFGFSNYKDMEELLSFLQILLRDYELRINYEKTDLLETPIPLNSEWVHRIKDIDFRNNHYGFRNDLIHMSDLMISLSKEYPRDSILKFGLSILARQECKEGNWGLYQALLNQMMKGEPSLIPQVFNHYLKYYNHGFDIHINNLTETLCEIIEWQSSMGNYFEVSYCLWFFIYFNIALPNSITEIISKLENSLIALLALDAESKNLTRNLDKTVWQKIVDEPDEWYNKNWLLAYEAVKKGWLLPTQTNHIGNDTFFKILYNNNVEFYNSDDILGKLKPILTSGSNPSTPQISLLSQT